MIPIVFSTDHNYVMPTGITITSLLLSRKEEEYNIYILTAPDVTEEDQDKLEEQVKCISRESNINFIPMNNKYENAHEIRGISKATYYRLMIPWLIPDEDRIIYSDVDMIFKSSLSEIYNVNLETKLLAASKNNTQKGWEPFKKYLKRLGLEYENYFNAGILVINAKLWRQEALNQQFDRLSRNKYLFQDQDILNIICKGKVTYFSNRFNLMPSLYGTQESLYNDVIIHYAGDKPWQTFTCAWSEWWDIYKNSVFREVGFYSKISRKILNPQEQLKSLVRKGTIKIQILKNKYF